MSLNPKLRAGLIIGALAVTFGAMRWVDSSNDDAAGNAEPDALPRERPSPRSNTQHTAGLDLQKLQRSREQDPDGDPFGPRTFRPPPPKVKAQPVAGAGAAAAIAPPPPPPQAPPLPFAYMGKLAEDQQTTVFLTAGDRNLVVRPGDVIDNTYRLEEVTDSTVVLTYLPMNQRQSLPIGVQ